jgi:hypothetical protein
MLQCHHTKSNRDYFDQSSQNGILLFWVIYDVVCAYGRQFIVGESNANLHGAWRVQDSYKGMSTRRQLLCLLWSILLIYNDPALENSFKMALQMTLGILLPHWDSLSQIIPRLSGQALNTTVNPVTQCFVSCVPIPLTTSLRFPLRSMERQARVGRVSISSTSIQKACLKIISKSACYSVGRSDTNEGRTLKESHTYEKHPTKMQQASHKQATNNILSHFYQLI